MKITNILSRFTFTGLILSTSLGVSAWGSSDHLCQAVRAYNRLQFVNAENCTINRLRGIEKRQSFRGVLDSWVPGANQDLLCLMSSLSLDLNINRKVVAVCDSIQPHVLAMFSFQLERQFLYISALFSNPFELSSGGGKAAIRFAIEQSVCTARQGVELMTVNAAKSFYERLGFVEDPEDEFELSLLNFTALRNQFLFPGFEELYPLLYLHDSVPSRCE